MYGDYMIALCDILGFSDLVGSQDLEQVVDGTLDWYQRALHHAVHHEDFPSDVPTLAELQDNELLGVAWFSDTILLWTLEDTDDAARQLVTAVGWLIFETMFSYSPSARGGISYGRAYMDPTNSRFVGRPIVNAYRLEQAQQWSGAALTPEAVERVPEAARDGHYWDWWVTPYAIPLKNGTLDGLAVNWTTGIHPPKYDVPWSSGSPEPTADDWEQRPSVCEKWRNTRQFHRDACRYCGHSARNGV